MHQFAPHIAENIALAGVLVLVLVGVVRSSSSSSSSSRRKFRSLTSDNMQS